MTDVQHALEWKEVKKTILALNLSIAQIDLSMTEGSNSVDTLIDSFNFLREGIDSIRNELNSGETKAATSHFLQDVDTFTDKVTAAIVAFQFYDKLSQRLQHVSKSLSALADIISSEDQSLDEKTWQNFQDKMEKYAAMREEYELFELIFKEGVSSEAAIEQMKVKMRQKLESQSKVSAQDDDIELF